MKTAKIILSVITIVFALLGLLKIFPTDIVYPLMLFAMATSLVLRSIEYKKSNDNSGFIFTVLTAVFVYVVIIYVTLIG